VRDSQRPRHLTLCELCGAARRCISIAGGVGSRIPGTANIASFAVAGGAVCSGGDRRTNGDLPI